MQIQFLSTLLIAAYFHSSLFVNAKNVQNEIKQVSKTAHCPPLYEYDPKIKLCKLKSIPWWPIGMTLEQSCAKVGGRVSGNGCVSTDPSIVPEPTVTQYEPTANDKIRCAKVNGLPSGPNSCVSRDPPIFIKDQNGNVVSLEELCKRMNGRRSGSGCVSAHPPHIHSAETVNSST